MRSARLKLKNSMKDPDPQLEFIVPEDQEGTRLDRYLADQLPQLSRVRVQELMDEGRVLVEGTARKPSYRVIAGESIAIDIPEAIESTLAPEDIPLTILYQDDQVAVIDKPAGMIVHPGAGEATGTLASALLYKFGGLANLSGIGGPLRPGIVHRLDKGTSGALVVALTNQAHLQLIEQFAEREIEKTYVALLHGNVKGDSGRIELPVARDLRHRGRMTARRRDGRPARTDWTVRMRMPGFTLVSAQLHTGRTHQLRVHFSSQGNPVVGDTLYGAPREPHAGGQTLEPLGRNFLHAARLRFVHPGTQLPVEARAKLPAELVAYARELARLAPAAPGAIDAALREYL
jgi:23S rRNA pseudouridine1911/1915/1917 synthase